jgi:YegS/Rv2252/BmrU family lipid kinase
MKAIVFLNRAAGALALEKDPEKTIESLLLPRGIEPEFRRTPPSGLQSEVTAALKGGVKLIVACGGDGTISSVASALVGTDVSLGILPRGTLNHFAKDVRIPLDLTAAADVIAAGHTEIIDVGSVNDQIFINNSSLGVYSQLAVDRDAKRKHWGIGKWVALCLAGIRMLFRFPMVHVRLEADESSKTRNSPIVFIGNNEYEFDISRVGTRSSLQRGQLSLYIANTQSRWGLLRLIARGLLGQLPQAQDFEASKHTEVWIASSRKSMLVALDGEISRMQLPLHYRIRPRALRVCVPPRPKLTDQLSPEPLSAS